MSTNFLNAISSFAGGFAESLTKKEELELKKRLSERRLKLMEEERAADSGIREREFALKQQKHDLDAAAAQRKIEEDIREHQELSDKGIEGLPEGMEAPSTLSNIKALTPYINALSGQRRITERKNLQEDAQDFRYDFEEYRNQVKDRYKDDKFPPDLQKRIDLIPRMLPPAVDEEDAFKNQEIADSLVNKTINDYYADPVNLFLKDLNSIEDISENLQILAESNPKAFKDLVSNPNNMRRIRNSPAARRSNKRKKRK